MGSIKVAYSGKYLKIHVESRRLPNGNRIALELVNHPGAAIIVPYLSETEVLMLHQYRPVLRRYIYEFPAGTLEPGESAYACAKREIVEETGYSAGKLERVAAVYPVPAYSTEKIVVYKASKLKYVGAKFDANEIIDVKTVTKQQAKQLFSAGKFVNAETICVLALCGWI